MAEDSTTTTTDDATIDIRPRNYPPGSPRAHAERFRGLRMLRPPIALEDLVRAADSLTVAVLSETQRPAISRKSVADLLARQHSPDSDGVRIWHSIDDVKAPAVKEILEDDARVLVKLFEATLRPYERSLTAVAHLVGTWTDPPPPDAAQQVMDALSGRLPDHHRLQPEKRL